MHTKIKLTLTSDKIEYILNNPKSLHKIDDYHYNVLPGTNTVFILGDTLKLVLYCKETKEYYSGIIKRKKDKIQKAELEIVI